MDRREFIAGLAASIATASAGDIATKPRGDWVIAVGGPNVRMENGKVINPEYAIIRMCDSKPFALLQENGKALFLKSLPDARKIRDLLNSLSV